MDWSPATKAQHPLAYEQQTPEFQAARPAFTINNSELDAGLAGCSII